MSHHLSSGSPSSPPPLPNPSLQSNSSKDLPVFLLLPTLAEHTRLPPRLTAFQQFFRTHTHPQPLCCLFHCCLCRIGPHPLPLLYHPHSLSHLLPYNDITFVLTGLLSKCPREKGKHAHCLVETTGIPNSSNWRVRACIWITRRCPRPEH